MYGLTVMLFIPRLTTSENIDEIASLTFRQHASKIFGEIIGGGRILKFYFKNFNTIVPNSERPRYLSITNFHPFCFQVGSYFSDPPGFELIHF